MDVTGDLTFDHDVSSVGDLMASALESATVNGENVVVSSGVTVQTTGQTTGGDIGLSAGDRIQLAVGSTVESSANVVLTSSLADADGIGSTVEDLDLAADDLSAVNKAGDIHLADLNGDLNISTVDSLAGVTLTVATVKSSASR